MTDPDARVVDFFQPGRTYLYDGPHGRTTKFLVDSTGRAPAGYERPDDTGPVARGWYARTDEHGAWRPLGVFDTTDFAGWRLDPDTEVMPQLAYHADYSGMTLGTYTSRTEAEKHCTTDLANNVDTGGQSPRWEPFSAHEPEDMELVLGEGADAEPTGYSVFPFELLTAYDPKAEG